MFNYGTDPKQIDNFFFHLILIPSNLISLWESDSIEDFALSKEILDFLLPSKKILLEPK